jgi:hypothetical protein
VTLARCPACNLPFAIVGRAHRCVPRPAPVAEQVEQTATELVAPARYLSREEVEDRFPSPKAKAARAKEKSHHLAGNPAETPALGAYQVAMGVTPPAKGSRTANRSAPAPIHIGIDLGKPGSDMHVEAVVKREPDGSLNVLSIKNVRKAPKRDRAAYMRDYRALQKTKQAGASA